MGVIVTIVALIILESSLTVPVAGYATSDQPQATPILPTPASPPSTFPTATATPDTTTPPSPSLPSSTATATPPNVQALTRVPIPTTAPTPMAVSVLLVGALSPMAGTDDVATACVPTASLETDAIDFGISRREEAGFPASTATMELTLASPGTGCSGMAADWTIQVSASDMHGPGDAVIPASAISFAGTTPDAIAPAGLSVEEAPLPLAATSVSTIRIATGSALVESGATWDVTLQVTAPDGTPPGIYTGRITIDIASGAD